jgi:hypothetical protein
VFKEAQDEVRSRLCRYFVCYQSGDQQTIFVHSCCSSWKRFATGLLSLTPRNLTCATSCLIHATEMRMHPWALGPGREAQTTPLKAGTANVVSYWFFMLSRLSVSVIRALSLSQIPREAKSRGQSRFLVWCLVGSWRQEAFTIRCLLLDLQLTADYRVSGNVPAQCSPSPI